MTSELLKWYQRAKRDLPWRQSQDPYAILVSEFMLQQTHVTTVMPHYARWMERFPTVEALAQADERAVLAVWQGLGYYRRPRNLLQVARLVKQGGWPSDSATWRRLPGVGEYTAAAMASICNHEPVAAVDGNVERVFARVNASRLVGAPLKRAARAWAQSLMDSDNPGDFNQAMMELGATVCQPRQPHCEQCPLGPGCRARKLATPNDFPCRKPKPPTVAMSRSLAVWIHQGLVAMRTAGPAEWWSGMRVFPEVPPERGGLEFVGRFSHTVTRHRICFEVWRGHSGAAPLEGYTWLSLEALPSEPLPAPMRKALDLALKAERGL